MGLIPNFLIAPFPGLATSPSSGYRRLVGSLFEIEDLGRDVLDTPSALANKP
jgi:hypothetical protein